MAAEPKSKLSLLAGKSPVFVCVLGVAITAGFLLPQAFTGMAPLPESDPIPASAGGDLSYRPPAPSSAVDPRALLLRLSLGTAGVLGLCVGTLWLCKRWLPGLVQTTQGNQGRLHLVETLSLGNRCCVHLLRVENQSLVAGVDGSGLKSLIALPESFESRLAVAGAEAAPGGNLIEEPDYHTDRG